MAAWAIAVAMAASVRANEVRVAQRLGTLASFPMIGSSRLWRSGSLLPAFPVAVEFAVGLSLADVVSFRTVARMFDRERLANGRHGGGAVTDL